MKFLAEQKEETYNTELKRALFKYSANSSHDNWLKLSLAFECEHSSDAKCNVLRGICQHVLAK